MFRRLLASFAAFAIVLLASTGLAFAAVDVNNADQTQLQTITGIGPATSARIIAERQKGNFRDWDDLIKRVPGIGDKNSAALSQGGLTVGGRSKADAPAAPSAPISKGVGMPAPPSTMVNGTTPAAPAAPVPKVAPVAPMTKAAPTAPVAPVAPVAPSAPKAPAVIKTPPLPPTPAAAATAPPATTTETTKSKKTGNDASAKSEMAKSADSTTKTEATKKTTSRKSAKDDAADTTKK